MCVVNVFPARFSYMVPTVDSGPLLRTHRDLNLQQRWRVFPGCDYSLERLSFEKTRGTLLTRKCIYLYEMVDKDYGGSAEYRTVTWSGGAVVSTVQETVLLEACCVPVAVSCPAAGVDCLVLL